MLPQRLTVPGYELTLVSSEHKRTDKVFGTLDWMQMFKKDGADIKGFGLSVGYKF